MGWSSRFCTASRAERRPSRRALSTAWRAGPGARADGVAALPFAAARLAQHLVPEQHAGEGVDAEAVGDEAGRLGSPIDDQGRPPDDVVLADQLVGSLALSEAGRGG